MSRLWIVTVFITTLALPAAGQADDARAPVPERALQAQAERTIKGLFGDQYSKKGVDDRQALAKALLECAEETEDDPAARYILFREAKDIAARSGELDVAVKATERLTECYRLPAIDMKLGTLKAVSRSVRSSAGKKALTEAYLKLVDEAVANDAYKDAAAAARVAVGLARSARNGQLLADARAKVKEADELARSYKLAMTARDALQQDPDSPEANLVAGRFLCFVKGAWDQGLPLLAKGSDAGLKALAEEELAEAPASAARVSIADGWWAKAEELKGVRRGRLRERALHHYRLSLPDLKGLTRMKVMERVGGSPKGSPTEKPKGVAVKHNPPGGPRGPRDGRPELSRTVTLTKPYPESYKGADTHRISVQYAVIELVKQAGLGYNWKESFKNTDPICRRWVYPNIRNLPCRAALAQLLGPVGLTYQIREGQVVLEKRGPRR